MSVFYQQACAVILIVFLGYLSWQIHSIAKNHLDESIRSGNPNGGWRRPARLGAENSAQEEQTSGQPGFFRYWWNQFAKGYSCLKVLFLRIREPETLRRFGVDMLIGAAVSVGMCMFCNYTDGGSDLYMTTFISMYLVVLGMLFLFTETVRGSRIISISCAVLILTGVALQVLLYLSPLAAMTSYHIEHPRKMVTFSLLAIFAAIIMFPMLRAVCTAERRTTVVVVLNLLLVGLYAVVLVFGKEVNNAKSWLNLGFMQFQVSEVTKTLSFAIMALEFTNDRYSHRWRCVHATATLLVNVGALALMNEFGTLCVVGVVYLLLALAYQKDLKTLFVVFLMLAVMAFCAYKICEGWYYTLYPEELQTEQAEQPEPAATEPTATEPAPTEPSPTGEVKEEPDTREKIMGLGALIYEKFDERFRVMLKEEGVNEDDEGYQIKQARNALMIADWFGSPYEVHIPEIKSDFIFPYLLLRMGVVYGCLVLLLVLLVLLVGVLRSMANPVVGEASVSLAFVLGIVVQALIAAASSTDNFITIGIPFAFLAYGGSAEIMNVFMLVFILYATRSEKLGAPRNSERRLPRRREV